MKMFVGRMKSFNITFINIACICTVSAVSRFRLVDNSVQDVLSMFKMRFGLSPLSCAPGHMRPARLVNPRAQG